METSRLSPLPSRPFHRLLLAAPLIFVAHVAEEAPGVITALLLYVPFSTWVIASAVRTRRLSAFAATIAVVLGALPMLVHGYMILFRGPRLF